MNWKVSAWIACALLGAGAVCGAIAIDRPVVWWIAAAVFYCAAMIFASDSDERRVAERNRSALR